MESSQDGQKCRGSCIVRACPGFEGATWRKCHKLGGRSPRRAPPRSLPPGGRAPPTSAGESAVPSPAQVSSRVGKARPLAPSSAPLLSSCRGPAWRGTEPKSPPSGGPSCPQESQRPQVSRSAGENATPPGDPESFPNSPAAEICSVGNLAAYSFTAEPSSWPKASGSSFLRKRGPRVEGPGCPSRRDCWGTAAEVVPPRERGLEGVGSTEERERIGDGADLAVDQESDDDPDRVRVDLGDPELSEAQDLGQGRRNGESEPRDQLLFVKGYKTWGRSVCSIGGLGNSRLVGRGNGE
nr:wiskott-Aldrich syndrome protein homolog 1-like [Coffea arabica]